MSWESASLCVDCWNRIEPDRQAVTITDKYRNEETCVLCNQAHKSGIFKRLFISEEGTVQL